MAMKINKLEIENVKRVKAVKAEFTPNGLTVIGGNNNQGKTSILDAIAWVFRWQQIQAITSSKTRISNTTTPTCSYE